MPIWPVSFTDGSYQVADADGALYPLMISGAVLRGLHPGWQPVGLQTGLPPFHVLELGHADGAKAAWFLDPTLELLGNRFDALDEEQRGRFVEHVGPLVRNIYEEAVLAAHAAVPAAAHEFDGFLPDTVHELIAPVAPNVPGRPDVVAAAALAGLSGGYSAQAGSSQALSSAWIEHALQTAVDPAAASLALPSLLDGTSVTSQERLDLQGFSAFRYFDPAGGLVYYLAAVSDGVRLLYVPAMSVIFTNGPVDTAADLPTMLLVYYATHIDRAVMLPELHALDHGLLHMGVPPQAGLDEPPSESLPPPPAPVGADEDLALAGMVSAPSALPHPAMPPAPVAEAAPRGPAPAAPLSSRSQPAPKQNWWQRLLGLGNA